MVKLLNHLHESKPESYPLKVLVITSKESLQLSVNTPSFHQRDVHNGLMIKCLRSCFISNVFYNDISKVLSYQVKKQLKGFDIIMSPTWILKKGFNMNLNQIQK